MYFKLSFAIPKSDGAECFAATVTANSGELIILTSEATKDWAIILMQSDEASWVSWYAIDAGVG